MAKPQYTCELSVDGMHCAACELTIEKHLKHHKKVKNVSANLASNKVVVTTDSPEKADSLAKDFNELLKDTGYTVSTKQQNQEVNITDYIKAGAITMVIVLIFILLQRMGLVTLITTSTPSLPVVFGIGLIASVSSCMAVVGGLVLTLSAQYAKTQKVAAISAFHIARIVGFFFLGGVMGLIGSAFTLNPLLTFVIDVILFVVMISVGINMLELFPLPQVQMPKFMGKWVLSFEGKRGWIMPMLLGVITFFLPCGFTQSMQVYALQSGNVLHGALIMLVFALGTFPALAVLSVASVKLSKTLQSGLFFKTAGMIIICFAAFNLLAALSVMGIIPPLGI